MYLYFCVVYRECGVYCVILHPPRQPRIKIGKSKKKKETYPNTGQDLQQTVKSTTPSPLPQHLPQSNQPKSTSTISQLPLHQTSVLKLNLDPSRISLLLLETHKYYYSDRTPSVRPDQWSHHVPSSKPEVTYSSQHFLRRAASRNPYPVPVYV